MMRKFINASEGKVRYSPYLPVSDLVFMLVCTSWVKEGKENKDQQRFFVLDQSGNLIQLNMQSCLKTLQEFTIVEVEHFCLFVFSAFGRR